LLQKYSSKFEDWLLFNSRTLLMGLIAANICLTFALIANQEPQSVGPSLPAGNVASNTDKIQLLTEVPALQPVSKPAPRECRTWGPERDPTAFDTLRVVLAEHGGFPELLETQMQGAPDYLVYIGDLGSRANAKRVAAELATQSIDSYLMRSEDGLPILSVGVFSRESLAQRQFAKVTGLGYAVAIEELERSQTIYNLSAHVAIDSELYGSSTSPCMAIAHNP